MKKRIFKKVMYLFIIYLIGVLLVLMMCKNAENWDKAHGYNKQENGVRNALK